MGYYIAFFLLIIAGFIIFAFFQHLVISDLKIENALLRSHLDNENLKIEQSVPDKIFQANEPIQNYLTKLSTTIK